MYHCAINIAATAPIIGANAGKATPRTAETAPIPEPIALFNLCNVSWFNPITW
ncbi:MULTISPECIES: hypothetical protein [unclassified Spiroplasma]|uniref:hypothetical protein n=1 Tax=unclassified Spiroplasma TaxID=2637901 RepID=UPI00207A47D2|nr:hypothetical protein [Spiroplasma endosymbiont of Lariophagus distinguendus]